MASSIFVVRHGDRFDFDMGWENWKVSCHPECVHDPPLSDLGLTMAIETSKILASAICPNGEPISKVISSPFLRCIQTAHPTATCLQLPLLLDHALFEVPFRGEYLPPPIERLKYFPQISTSYESSLYPQSPEPYPEGSIDRYMNAAYVLARRFENENIVLVTHAAGVMSIVASLTQSSVCDIPPASPCGIYRLDLQIDSEESSTEQGEPSQLRYSLATDFSGSVSHLSVIGKTTPWPMAGVRQFDDSFISAGSTPPWKVTT